MEDLVVKTPVEYPWIGANLFSSELKDIFSKDSKKILMIDKNIYKSFVFAILQQQLCCNRNKLVIDKDIYKSFLFAIL